MPFIGRKNGTLTARQQCYNDVHGWYRAIYGTKSPPPPVPWRYGGGLRGGGMGGGGFGGSHTRRCIHKAVHTKGGLWPPQESCYLRGHTQGGTHTRRYTHKAGHTQGGAHNTRSVATAGVLLFKRGCGGWPLRRAKRGGVRLLGRYGGVQGGVATAGVLLFKRGCGGWPLRRAKRGEVRLLGRYGGVRGGGGYGGGIQGGVQGGRLRADYRARIEQLFARLWHYGFVRNIWRGCPNELHQSVRILLHFTQFCIRRQVRHPPYGPWEHVPPHVWTDQSNSAATQDEAEDEADVCVLCC